MSTHGVIDLPSKHSVLETADHFEQTLLAKGMKIFARIDQAAEARAVGLEMRPMILILFGDPKVGTPLMKQFPTLAIDLPLKLLIWQAEDEQVYVSFVSSGHLQKRHQLPTMPFPALHVLLSMTLNRVGTGDYHP